MKMTWDMSWSNSKAGRKFDADQEKRLKRGIKRAQKEEASWTQEKRDTYVVFKKTLVASFIVFGLPVVFTIRYYLVLLILEIEFAISIGFLIIAHIRRDKIKYPICYKTPLFAFCACVFIFLSNLGRKAISNAIGNARIRKAQENAIKNDIETQQMLEEMNKMFGKVQENNKEEAGNE